MQGEPGADAQTIGTHHWRAWLRRGLVMVSGCAVALSTMTVPAPAAAVEDPVSWTGTIQTRWFFVDSDPSNPEGRVLEFRGSATYSSLEDLGDGGYGAIVDLAGTETDSQPVPYNCRTDATVATSGRYVDPADPAGTTAGAALSLRVSDRGVLFSPHLLVVDYASTTHCEGFDPTSWTGHATSGGFASGETWSAPLTDDTDPDPGRFTGQMDWTLDAMPDGHKPLGRLSSYAFSVSYDLRPDRPLPDDDADGIFNAADNCPLVRNTDQLDADADGTGDLCEVAMIAVDDSIEAQTRAGGDTIAIHVLGNDVGDGLQLLTGYPLTGPTGGPPIGSVTLSAGSLLWSVPTTADGKPRLGVHFLGYEARDQYGNRDTAVVKVRLFDCATLTTGVLSTEEWARLGWRQGYCFDGARVWGKGAHSTPTDNADRINIILGALGFEQRWTTPIIPKPHVGSRYGWTLGIRNTYKPPRLQFCVGVPEASLKAAMRAMTRSAVIAAGRWLTGRTLSGTKTEVIDAIFDAMDAFSPRPCWTTNQVAANLSVEPNGRFVYSHDYGRSKGGYKHTFRLRYSSGATHPVTYTDGARIVWRGDWRRPISIRWTCQAHTACKPKIEGQG
jgi:hypothetical protein